MSLQAAGAAQTTEVLMGAFLAEDPAEVPETVYIDDVKGGLWTMCWWNRRGQKSWKLSERWACMIKMSFAEARRQGPIISEGPLGGH